MDVIVDFETGSKVIFDTADGVFFETTVDVRNNRMKIWNKNVDLLVFTVLVGEADHRKEGAKIIA